MANVVVELWEKRQFLAPLPLGGLKKREGKVFVVPVPECWEDELMPIIKGLVLENSAINTDGSYDGLILKGFNTTEFIIARADLHAKSAPTNGTQNFWGYG